MHHHPCLVNFWFLKVMIIGVNFVFFFFENVCFKKLELERTVNRGQELSIMKCSWSQFCYSCSLSGKRRVFFCCGLKRFQPCLFTVIWTGWNRGDLIRLMAPSLSGTGVRIVPSTVDKHEIKIYSFVKKLKRCAQFFVVLDSVLSNFDLNASWVGLCPDGHTWSRFVLVPSDHQLKIGCFINLDADILLFNLVKL